MFGLFFEHALYYVSHLSITAHVSYDKFCDTVCETRMDLLMVYMTEKHTPHPFCSTWMLGFNFYVLLTVHPCIIL